MHLMSASIVAFPAFPSPIRFLIPASIPHCTASSPRLLPRCANKARRRHSDPRPWWQRFFSDEQDWVDWGAGDVEEPADAVDEDAKYLAWKKRAEAISELREAQEDARNAEGRDWEDWLEPASSASSPPEQDWDWSGTTESSSQMSGDDPEDFRSDNSLVGAIKGFIFRKDDGDLLFEDRVFRFASRSSAKFVALLVLVPWTLDFLVHDYVLMPFLDRYVEKVPLAAELLDVRRHQKLEMIKALKVEKARFRLEVEIGKSPPLSDEEIWLELRHKAIELRDEWRLENRRAFANIWSDLVYGIALFALIYLNKSKVALLKFTGYKLLNNVSDTGKAFLIILFTDIFLGYHSESGWQLLTEILLERYGLEVDQAAITVFICTVPVVIDACVKLWLFRFLPKLSPNVTNIFREMKRH